MKHFYFHEESHFSSLRRQLHLGAVWFTLNVRYLSHLKNKRENKVFCKQTHNLSRLSFNLGQLVDKESIRFVLFS